MLRSTIRVAFVATVVVFALVGASPSISFLGMAAQEKGAQPKKGNAQKSSTQPAIVEAFEVARVFAQVSGVLTKETIDIGDRVKRGQVLAVLESADMEARLKHDNALVNQARARVELAKIRLVSTEADLQTVMLVVKQAEDTAKSAAASVRYRLQQHKRMEELFKTKTIDEGLLDESKERYEAAVAAEQAAKAAVATAKAQAVAGFAKVELAKAYLATAEAGVMVAQSNLGISQVQLSKATIKAPFDGVVTQRGYLPGDSIKAADQKNNDAPLFTIQQTAVVRVIVSIPDRDVPFVEVGDAAELEIDAFPGKKWSAKVSRMAAVLDPKTRGIVVEIDLPNPTGEVRPGMSGRATIVFGKRKE